jgi:glucose/arabinose dehydrogenase
VKSKKCLQYVALLFVLASATRVNAAGPLQRVPNTTLQMPATPAQFGYTVNNAFPTVSLSSPVCIASPPGETNRLFILEKGLANPSTGNIVVITNLASPNRTVFMSLTVMGDSESGFIGLAFHPGYATNGYFYVFSSRNLTTSQGTGRHQCISRFQVTATNANFALPTSELMLIAQRDAAGNHNGGDLHFGPDGYLYASLGDEGAQYNGDGNAQRITNDFFSAILRLDVDKRPGNLPPNAHLASYSTNYAIPADNPYVGLTNFNGVAIDPTKSRTEFYSIGYRNPWRMSFDRGTGFLYVGDVGQDQYEEVSVITNGANAGWAYYEGLHLAKTLYPSQPNIQTGPPPGLVFPIAEYPHSNPTNANYQGNAVIGGVVYRGTRISQLYGAYVFSDNGSGKLWMLRYDGTNATPFQYLNTDAAGPSAFGIDPRNGDILIAQLNNNQIGRLDYNATQTGTPLPATLAATGAFSDLVSLTPNAGIVSYDLNVPFWSDNAIKSRWFSVPNTNLAINFNPTNNWLFPTGSVWIKHFELELTNGVPASRKRLETRFIVRNTNGVYGVTYRWTTPPTNALLVAETGLDEVFTNYTAGGAILNTQVWHYPGRAECLACHTLQGGHALGFNTAQLNRDFNYSGTTTNQIEALRLAGYFSNAVPNRYLLPTMAHSTNDAVSLEYRARSYFAANCVQCHQPGGIVSALWDARLSTPGPQNGIVNGPVNNNFGNTNSRVIAPGSLANSILFQRVANLGPGHMPPLATSVVNTQAVTLLAAWITNGLSSYQSYADWQLNYFGSTNASNAAQLADPDADGAKNYLEYLIGTSPTNAASAWGISIIRSNGNVSLVIPQVANRAFEIQSSLDLLNINAWSPLNLPANAPFFPISNRTAVVEEAIQSGTPKYYRARVYEP